MRNGNVAISVGPPPAPDRRWARRAARQRGFTYLGLLIAVTIIGVALATVGVVWQTAQQRDRERELLWVGDQFRLAIGRYYRAGRQYPANLEDLLRDPRLPGVARYLRKIYHDPITGTTDWGLVRDASGGIVGVYSPSEARPIKQADFSGTDQGFEDKEKLSEWVFVYRPRVRTGPTLQPQAPAAAAPAPTGPPGPKGSP